MSTESPVARLTRAVSQLLDAARRGECRPEFVELLALHTICSREGAHDSSRAIREYIEERWLVPALDVQSYLASEVRR